MAEPSNSTSTTYGSPCDCYKSEMSKIIEQWLLFKYVSLEFTPLSKPFKTREQAEKAREKYPERLRKRIGLGVIQIKSSPHTSDIVERAVLQELVGR
jgi:hypothetical protein